MESLFRTARALKKNRSHRKDLESRTLGLVFSKPSTRTRISFEVAMAELGGRTTFMRETEVGMGEREEIRDVARTLSRYLAGIVVRTHSQRHLEELARYSSVPVINGLSESHHPCQALADLFTIWELKGGFRGITLSYVGDGNNVLNSLLMGASRLGLNVCVASPKGYGPKPSLIRMAGKAARRAGGALEVGEDPKKAVREADFVYTDVWTSMGFEEERDERIKAFRPYQLNAGLVAHAKKGVRVMHCLPAHRGEEITGAVIDGPKSIVFEQAENRLHVQKAILLDLLK
ncbi:MAG: ornithine carbamoyltransferase [Candidatus Omnitrophica bacterium]|nr:ornithine carbamoyltransferase [Candidatus Omnitrophota bacterium]